MASTNVAEFANQPAEICRTLAGADPDDYGDATLVNWFGGRAVPRLLNSVPLPPLDGFVTGYLWQT